jgi:lipoate-protein ligase B
MGRLTDSLDLLAPSRYFVSMNERKEPRKPCRAFRLGIFDYEPALRLQNRLAAARIQEETRDVLLLLQHPPVITLGKSGKTDNVLVPAAILADRQIRLIYTDRGGDVTYHGPGQLVVYPILNLQAHRLTIPQYVWSLEEAVIRVLARYKIAGGRVEKLRGVWLGLQKICSVGVHVSRGVTKHGLALNVNTDLDPFTLINPCGTGRPVTSMAKVLNREVPIEEVERLILESFAEIFDLDIAEEPSAKLEASL